MSVPIAPAVPRLWSVRRLNRLAQMAAARSYLEIGVAAGHTLMAVQVPRRTGVDPLPRLDADAARDAGVELVVSRSDAFLAALDPEVVFDLVFIDGLHTFEQAYRDLCGVLLHSHPRSLVLLDDTLPVDVYSTLRDQSQAISARRAAGGSGTDWHGDVFKVIFAIHDFHHGLAWATITGSGNPQTLVWRTSGEQRTPALDSLEAISRLTYFDLLARDDILRPMPEEEAMVACAEALSRSATGASRGCGHP